MDHPNISKVYDAGSTEQGRPYFIMELVRGIKITDFCDQEKINTRERLNLFIKVRHQSKHFARDSQASSVGNSITV